MPRGLAKAPAGDDEFAGEPLRILGGEEGDDACDVIGLASASERRLLNECLLKVGANETCAVRTLGFDDAGIYRVDADLLWTKLLCEHTGNGVERTLRRRVNRAIGRGEAADAGADVDDAGTFAKVFCCGLRGKQDAEER